MVVVVVVVVVVIVEIVVLVLVLILLLLLLKGVLANSQLLSALRLPSRPQRTPEGPQKAPQESLMQLPGKPRLGSREPRDCPSEFYAVGAVCVKFIYGPKIPKKAPKDPRGTPEGAPRRPDAAPKTVPRRVKIASRWPAGILRGGRRARKIHRMPQRSQESSEGA